MALAGRVGTGDIGRGSRRGLGGRYDVEGVLWEGDIRFVQRLT
jgi:hypothetical protein